MSSMPDVLADPSEEVCRRFFEAAAAALGVNMAFRVSDAIGPRAADELRDAAISLLDIELIAWIAALARAGLDAELLELFRTTAQQHMRHELAAIAATPMTAKQ